MADEENEVMEDEEMALSDELEFEDDGIDLGEEFGEDGEHAEDSEFGGFGSREVE